MKSLDINRAYFTDNCIQLKQENLGPKSILETQRAIWAQMGIKATQHTLAKDFLLIGTPFEHTGKIYSRIFNNLVWESSSYEEPTIGALNSHDEAANVRKGVFPGLVWQHQDQTETDVKDWYEHTDAEAKGGRILFNLHRQNAWAAIFHEPVHEAAPLEGGIGTAPKWAYEGYCEIFASKLAVWCGVNYLPYREKSYVPFSAEVHKLISFTSEKCVAKAYFENDTDAYDLLCPLFWKRVKGSDLEPAIPARFIPQGDVPEPIKERIQQVGRRGNSPKWYRQWVDLYGRGLAMPALSPLAARGGPPPMPLARRGALPPQVGPPLAQFTGRRPPESWVPPDLA
jgi:hypothetical protein